MKKPIIEIIIPAGACACSFAPWIGRVYNILGEFRDKCEVISIPSDSARAKELKIEGQTIVVNNKVVYLNDLKESLKELLGE